MPNPNDRPLEPDWDDDPDDRPPPRRRPRPDDPDDYDEEYDERPRRRRPPPKSSGSVWIIVIVVGVIMVVGVAAVIGLLLISVSKVREAAARVKDQNNLKQIAVGMYADNNINNRGIYAPFAHDKQGNVVEADLSFRVSLLPHIEQNALYNQFDLKQGWSSAQNQRASGTPVPTYQTPFDDKGTVTTPYRAFVGGGAMFNEDGRPVRLTEVSDGTANTIMLVHARDQMPWAAPPELRYSPNAPLPALGHPGLPKGTNVLMADGSVRFLRADTPEPVVRGLITRSGGEQIPSDW